MNSMNLRRKLFLKRKLLKFIGYNPRAFTSLVQKERPSLVNYDQIGSYAKPLHIEMLDTRNGKMRGHYFEERNIYLLKNVVLEPFQGIIYTEDGFLIEESTTWSTDSQYHSFPWNFKGLESKLNLNEALYISSNSFGHWLMEDLALTIKTMSLFPNSPIICLHNPPKYISEFLATTGRDVVYVSGPVRVNSIVIISNGNDSGWVHPQDYFELTNYQPFLSAINRPSNTKSIFASRIGLRRSPSNENIVEKIFQDLGYESVHLEDYSLLSEISLIAGISRFAGVHGSSFVNQIWMQGSPRVTELVNSNYWTEMDFSSLGKKSIDRKIFTYNGPTNCAIPVKELEIFLSHI